MNTECQADLQQQCYEKKAYEDLKKKYEN